MFALLEANFEAINLKEPTNLRANPNQGQYLDDLVDTMINRKNQRDTRSNQDSNENLGKNHFLIPNRLVSFLFIKQTCCY